MRDLDSSAGWSARLLVPSARRATGAGITVELARLTRGHAAAVLAFEIENRAYFARTIPDRGEDYFTSFAERHEALMVEQDGGACAFHVLITAAGAVVGRINLYDVRDGQATLGYRLAEAVTGRGVATAAVERVAVLARQQHGLRVLGARAAKANVASTRVLEKSGFRPVGPLVLNGLPATRYERRLV